MSNYADMTADADSEKAATRVIAILIADHDWTAAEALRINDWPECFMVLRWVAGGLLSAEDAARWIDIDVMGEVGS